MSSSNDYLKNRRRKPPAPPLLKSETINVVNNNNNNNTITLWNNFDSKINNIFTELQEVETTLKTRLYPLPNRVLETLEKIKNMKQECKDKEGKLVNNFMNEISEQEGKLKQILDRIIKNKNDLTANSIEKLETILDNIDNIKAPESTPEESGNENNNTTPKRPIDQDRVIELNNEKKEKEAADKALAEAKMKQDEKERIRKEKEAAELKAKQDEENKKNKPSKLNSELTRLIQEGKDREAANKINNHDGDGNLGKGLNMYPPGPDRNTLSKEDKDKWDLYYQWMERRSNLDQEDINRQHRYNNSNWNGKTRKVEMLYIPSGLEKTLKKFYIEPYKLKDISKSNDVPFTVNTSRTNGPAYDRGKYVREAANSSLRGGKTKKNKKSKKYKTKRKIYRKTKVNKKTQRKKRKTKRKKY